MAGRQKKETALTPEERLQAALVPVEEQPYAVPGNWCWTRIRDINQYQSITVDPSRDLSDHFELYSVPSSANNFPEILTGEEIGSTKLSVKMNDVLLCKINPRINRVWKVAKHTEYSLIASSEWIIIRNDGIDSDYLMWCFRSPYFREIMLSNVSGVGGSLMRAQPKFVQNYPIPIPPLLEQHRIVALIDSLFSKLDEAKEKVQAVVDGFENRRAAILHKAFTGELTAGWREKHDVSINDWSDRKLLNCGSWCGGGTPSISNNDYWAEGKIPWVTSKDMKSDLIEDTLVHVNMVGIENSSAKYIDAPSVLFVVRSGILRRTLPIAMIKVPFTVNQDLKVMTPCGDIELEYLFWACKSSEATILEQCMKSGTTVESINVKKLMEFCIPIAPQDEQREIVRILDSLLAKEKQAKEAAEAVLEKIEVIKKAILAWAFRGELGTNDPAEESAVELLKQTVL